MFGDGCLDIMSTFQTTESMQNNASACGSHIAARMTRLEIAVCFVQNRMERVQAEVLRNGSIRVHVYDVARRIAKSTRDSDLALIPAKQHTVLCL